VLLTVTLWTDVAHRTDVPGRAGDAATSPAGDLVVSAVMQCPSCGAEVTELQKFCAECGTDLRPVAEPTDVATEPPEVGDAAADRDPEPTTATSLEQSDPAGTDLDEHPSEPDELPRPTTIDADLDTQPIDTSDLPRPTTIDADLDTQPIDTSDLPRRTAIDADLDTQPITEPIDAASIGTASISTEPDPTGLPDPTPAGLATEPLATTAP
jgi:hypothetical protein